MLSTNSTSSIQKRRQLHRRQQSLEVPILATPLPANPRRHKPAAHAHRRGLSLDQSLSALNTPTAFRPLLPQDHDQDQFQGTPPVRIQIDSTNAPGHPIDQQHFTQDTQQHKPAQPGYQAQDFQTHLQQQLNGNVGPQIVAPTPTHPNQEQALQELQHHLEWYRQRFGHSPAPTVQTTATNSFFHLNQPNTSEMCTNQEFNTQAAHQPIVAMPHTPVSHGHSHTVPNTPQHHLQSWPSPPPSHVKHGRSQSTQFEVAPMPTSFDGGHIMKTSSPYSAPQGSFTQDSFATNAFMDQFEQHYASSAYSSSIIDPSSPGPSFNAGPMPTLFEETTFTDNGAPNGLPDDTLLLQATAGADEHDFNSPNFVIGGGSVGMSPRTAMMHNLGDDVNATLIDTGIDPAEVDALISEMNPDTNLFYCMFELNSGKTCKKWFKRRENARSHVQNHLGDRQFRCNDCGKTFVRQHDMKRHAAIHKDEREHVCPCGNAFARHDALTRHRQRGMCEGTLPGYEKAEEDKPKRGRPKKERPGEKARTTKANKARELDRQNELEAFNYASPTSSSAGMDDHSLPMTPPDTSDDFDADAFINMANEEIDYHTATSSWRDTPPTSPAPGGISPHLLTKGADAAQQNGFMGCSSPLSSAEYDAFELGVAEPTPRVGGRQELFSCAVSVYGDGSTDGSSPFTADDGWEMGAWRQELAQPVTTSLAEVSFRLEEAMDAYMTQ